MCGSKRFHLKLHAYGGLITMAVCDEHLLGRTLKDETHEFIVSKGFYGGDIVSKESFLSTMKNVKSANFIGNQCVDILVGEGIVDTRSVLIIGGEKHVQIYDLSDLHGGGHGYEEDKGKR